MFNCLICLTTEASNQNRAARVLTFSRYDVDANRFFRKLNWKDLSTQFQIQKALMIYKSLNDLVPGYLSSKFVKRYETRYSLRDSVNKVIVPFPRTNFMKNSFSYSGAVLWNSLPCDMREVKSLSQFKQERIKGTEKASQYTPYSIGNSSRVIFRIGIKLPRALRGCFVEVSHD